MIVETVFDWLHDHYREIAWIYFVGVGIILCLDYFGRKRAGFRFYRIWSRISHPACTLFFFPFFLVLLINFYRDYTRYFDARWEISEVEFVLRCGIAIAVLSMVVFFSIKMLPKTQLFCRILNKMSPSEKATFRKFSDAKLVIASHNKGKVREIGELLAPHGVEVVSAGELGLDEPEETGTTFVANAVIKAEAAAKAAGLPALADDSGLAVHALGGEPGIHSARWAGPERDFGLAMRKVEEALDSKADRSAHFACALALCWPDGHCETFEGTVHGTLVWPPRGERGFGYDPVFQPNGHSITFGEMEPERKHAMSHRADAFQKLVKNCFGSATK